MVDYSKWGVDDVCTWLEREDMGALSDKFRAEEIDGEVLQTLSDGDLREMSLTLGTRKKLRRRLDALQRGSNAKKLC